MFLAKKTADVFSQQALRGLVAGLAFGLVGEGGKRGHRSFKSSAAAGQWDMSLADSSRTCRMTLRAAGSDGPKSVSMPAGCRRSLPILSTVGTFEVPRADHIALADISGKPVLDFAADGGLPSVPMGHKARPIVSSRSRVLSRKANIWPRRRRPRRRGFQPVETKSAESTAVPSRITAALKPGDLAGRYGVLRDGNKDTGCMITLDDKTRAAKGGFKATLAPACRDQGIVIFDPMGWQLAGGRLVLTARKGHTTHLDLQPDSTWAKDPKEGKALSLKKQ